MQSKMGTQAQPVHDHRAEAQGRVYWFTGLAGVGKSSLARAFAQKLRNRGSNVIYLDGDELRRVLGDELGYTRKDRQRASARYSRLCSLLATQGFDVVCATISLFHDCQAWNRLHIANYREIFITAPPDVLARRNRNHLYGDETHSPARNVVGVDIAPEFPKEPDLVILNEGKTSIDELSQQIWNAMRPANQPS